MPGKTLYGQTNSTTLTKFNVRFQNACLIYLRCKKIDHGNTCQFKGAVSWILVKIWKAKETCLPMANKKLMQKFLQHGYFSSQKPFHKCFKLRIAQIKMSANP